MAASGPRCSRHWPPLGSRTRRRRRHAGPGTGADARRGGAGHRRNGDDHGVRGLPRRRRHPQRTGAGGHQGRRPGGRAGRNRAGRGRGWGRDRHGGSGNPGKGRSRERKASGIEGRFRLSRRTDECFRCPRGSVPDRHPGTSDSLWPPVRRHSPSPAGWQFDPLRATNRYRWSPLDPVCRRLNPELKREPACPLHKSSKLGGNERWPARGVASLNWADLSFLSL